MPSGIFNRRNAQAILEIKRRDFELAQFRLAQPFGALADGYRTAIADFLGENRKNVRPARDRAARGCRRRHERGGNLEKPGCA